MINGGVRPNRSTEQAGGESRGEGVLIIRELRAFYTVSFIHNGCGKRDVLVTLPFSIPDKKEKLSLPRTSFFERLSNNPYEAKKFCLTRNLNFNIFNQKLKEFQIFPNF